MVLGIQGDFVHFVEPEVPLEPDKPGDDRFAGEQLELRREGMQDLQHHFVVEFILLIEFPQVHLEHVSWCGGAWSWRGVI